jgi:hypothetical protein
VPSGKKNAWSRLFTGVSSSDDDSLDKGKEKAQSKGKIKKVRSYSEIPKVVIDSKPEIQTRKSSDVDQVKTTVEPPLVPVPSPPTSSSQPKPNKKESGIFASLFGSKKKSDSSKEKQTKNDTSTVPLKPSIQDRSQYQRHGPSGWTDQGNAYPGPPAISFYYTRFPIHVERAIYRLSHIKLANPRRPLLQQVLLSNFMYGYLNLINKAAQPTEQAVPQTQEYTEPETQVDDHVFYAGDEQNVYYGQDYYGSEYDEDHDDVSTTLNLADG